MSTTRQKAAQKPQGQSLENTHIEQGKAQTLSREAQGWQCGCPGNLQTKGTNKMTAKKQKLIADISRRQIRALNAYEYFIKALENAKKAYIPAYKSRKKDPENYLKVSKNCLKLVEKAAKKALAAYGI